MSPNDTDVHPFNDSNLFTTTILSVRSLNTTIFNQMGWQYWYLIGLSVPSLPLYLLIIVTVFVRKPSVSAGNTIMATRRLNDVFYNLIISQGFADLLAIIVYFFSNVLQSLPSLDPFFQSNSSWVAPLSYNNVYFFLVLRSNGIMLFSIQRYLVFVKDITNDRYKQQPLYTVLLIHWGPSFVIMLPVTCNLEKSFDQNGATTVSPIQLGLSSGIACVTLIFNSIVSGLCYVAVINAIYKKSSRKLQVFISFRKTREFRLSVQVFFQIFAMMNCLAYHSIQFCVLLVKPDYSHTLNHIREYYPIITCELSYVNPWIFIFLNNRLRAEMFTFIGVKKKTNINMLHTHFMEKKSSIFNNSNPEQNPRRASSLARLSLANLPQIVR